MARIQNQRLAAFLALSLAGALSAADLPAKIRKVLGEGPAIERGFLGLKIVDLATGKVLFEDHANSLFVPASNSKLFAAALALVRLGPDYRFRTTVIAGKEPDSEGRLDGDLSLIGGGDPNLSGRELPYRVDSPPGDALQAIEDLAGQIVARGVRRIEGDIVGDDTAYTWAPYPPGWALDDALWEYGAPVSALTINDNTFTLKILPGDPARISVDPPLDFYQIDNLLRPGSERKIKVDREAGSRQLRVSGTLPLRGAGQSEILAIHDPALYAAVALRDALTRRGVDVRGEAVARHALPGEPAALPVGVELARRDSGPLLEDLRVTAKVSQNLHAELMVRAVGRARRGSGSLEAGLEEMQEFAKEIGITPDEFQPRDASGLSRLNLVSPAAVVKLLQFMYRSPQRENWIGLLPIGGEDGTLQTRLRNTSAARRIHAKTGSLTHVNSLSGYAERADGTMLAFSFLTNNQNAPAAEIRAALDKLCVAMTE
jgi:D-alanyl-D-alanine carboxypeptidase/D-alanyl-D-alanine-endopeptidase (penicillin-binding protein 4)